MLSASPLVMDNPPTPHAVKVILTAERARIIDAINERIASWVEFHETYPPEDHPDAFLIISELEYIRSVIDAPKNHPANHPGS